MYKSRDKDSPLKSKKFIAYLLSSILTKCYMFFATANNESDIVLVTVIVCALFLEIGYILGQSSLDKYVRLAEIGASKLIDIKEDDSKDDKVVKDDKE